MAQVAIVALAKFFIAVGVKATIAKFAATVFVYAASAYLLSRASKSLTPKSRALGSLSGAEISYFDTGAPMRIAYGRVRTGGMETIPPIVSGENNKFLHKVLTLTGHEVDSYNFAHFDATTITNAQVGAMAFSSSDGMVTAGVYSGHAFIRRYQGTSTDSADRILCDVLSSAFGFSRGFGVSKAAVSFAFNDDIYKSTPNPTFTYQGKRCYDPRLDASPGAAPTNPSFAAWTQNPALTLADYLMADYGGNYDANDIDWSTVVTAANYCEGTVTVPPVGTQPRYTINGVLLASDEFQDNVKVLVDAMLGRIVFSNGRWRMYAGSWKTPDFSIEKADWVSGLSIKFEQGKKKRFNRMRVWFIDQTRDWQRVECFPRSNASYLTADKGVRVDAETEQLLCTDQHEAQRKGEFLLRQSRNQITVAGRLPPRFQNIALWDTGTIVFDDLGWSSKTFRAVSLDINEDGSIDGVFAEEQSDDWDDTITYDSDSTAGLPVTNSTSPSEPRNFAATPQINGTIVFAWDKPIVNPIGATVQIIRATNSADASVGTVVWEGNASPVPLVMPTSPHWYWSRTHWKDRFSAYMPNTFGLGVVARLEADQTLQHRMCGDAEFEYGAPSSLWQLAGFRNIGGQGTFDIAGFGGAIMGNILLTDFDASNSVGLFQNSYSPTGGQYGGYMNVRQHATQLNSAGVFGGLLLAANPLNSAGFAYNNEPIGIEYVARVRINSFNVIAGQVFEFGTMTTFSTPNSPNMALWTGRFLVTSNAIFQLGEWATVRGFGVVLPAGVAAAVGTTQHAAIQSGTGYNMRPGIRLAMSGSRGNFDFDFIQATNIGLPNAPQASTIMQQGLLYEFMTTINQVLNPNLSTQGLFFPNSEVHRWADWRQWPIGRRFNLSKSVVLAPSFINPSSGMTLKLAGRAAVGTVTFISSFPGHAVVEKTNESEFTVYPSGGLI